jgi:hypothetical protein
LGLCGRVADATPERVSRVCILRRDSDGDAQDSNNKKGVATSNKLRLVCGSQLVGDSDIT